MTRGKKEAVAIARLTTKDGDRVVGWVYRWNTADLSILWISATREAIAIEPPLSPEAMTKARDAGSEALVDYLETLARGRSGDID